MCFLGKVCFIKQSILSFYSGVPISKLLLERDFKTRSSKTLTDISLFLHLTWRFG